MTVGATTRACCVLSVYSENGQRQVLTSYGEFSILSPRNTSPRFSALGTILLGRQYGML